MKLEHESDFHWLILFALPTIFSSIFANLYTTVDGIFVAQWVNTDALSAILSFCRTMVFMVIPVLVLPRFFEMDCGCQLNCPFCPKSPHRAKNLGILRSRGFFDCLGWCHSLLSAWHLLRRIPK